MDLQNLIDTISNVTRAERSKYHLTLGGLIKALEGVAPPTRVLIDRGFSPSVPHSYRGYYEDLAFEVSAENMTAGEFLNILKEQVLEKTFTGYKGGDFVMGERTPLWISERGEASAIGIMGAVMFEGALTLLTEKIEC